MKYWLMKSEPSVYCVEDLERDGVTGWEGVRNYQARNFMRDEMAVGDMVLFYHSNTNPPGIVGIMRVVKEAYPDETAMQPVSPYFDAKACAGSKGNPWVRVDVAFVASFSTAVTLPQLRETPQLASLMVIRKGCRLSVQPVDRQHFVCICRLGGVPSM